MGVVGREGCADLVVRHNGKIDQETEDPGAQEIPETDRARTSRPNSVE